MSGLSINIKKPIVKDATGKIVPPNNKTLQTVEDAEKYVQAGNMVTGGIVSNILFEPRWKGKLTKAGITVLDVKTKNENYTLLFQYNPNTIEEKRRVTYELKKNLFNGDFSTEFKTVEPVTLTIQFILDAFYDYFDLDEIYKNLISGGVQGVMVAGSMGSTLLSEVSFGQRLIDKGLSKRSLIPAITNIRNLVKNGELKYYKYESEKFKQLTGEDEIAKLKKDGKVLILRDTPPVCKLSWEGFSETQYVITDMAISHIMFDKDSLAPIRSLVSLSLSEYRNPLQDALDTIDSGSLIKLMKGE